MARRELSNKPTCSLCIAASTAKPFGRSDTEKDPKSVGVQRLGVGDISGVVVAVAEGVLVGVGCPGIGVGVAEGREVGVRVRVAVGVSVAGNT